jgi:hypothetical protein
LDKQHLIDETIQLSLSLFILEMRDAVQQLRKRNDALQCAGISGGWYIANILCITINSDLKDIQGMQFSLPEKVARKAGLSHL